MKRTALTVALLVVLSAFFVTVAILLEVRAVTLYVGGGGPSNYTTIQSAVDDAMPGDTVYVYSGVYLENVVLNKTVTLIGENRKTTTINGNKSGDAVNISADWVNVSRFTITEGGDLFWEAGIGLHSVRNCHIYNNNVSLNYGDGIYLTSSSNNTLSHNNVSSNDVGINLVGSDDNKIIKNNFSANDWIGIKLDTSSNNIVSNNTMVKNGIHISGRLEHWNTHTIDTSNTVDDKPVHYWKDMVGGTIPPGAGQVILANCSNVAVENQNVSNGNVGILLGFSANNTIANNTATSNTTLSSPPVAYDFERFMGIMLFSSSNNIMTNNRLSGNLIGIFLSSSTDVILSTNNISNNYYGIRLEYSGNATIVRNVLFGSIGDGIYFFRSSDITIAENNVSNNGNVPPPTWLLAGIHSDLSTNATIIGNDVSRNRYGIYLYYSTDITVHHNNVVNNMVQAGDDGGNGNSWDDGYPSGGNFWSDYAGIDELRGPNQDRWGSDGIGDTPYAIDADSQDRYPLVYPQGTGHPWPPSILQAALTGKDLESVAINWSLSPDDGAGLGSVVAYEVYRNTTYDHRGMGYKLAASLPNGTSTFIDTSAGEGDFNDYFYRVCAIDLSNNTACTYNQAAKFTRPLSIGSNLISIPLIQSNESIETVLQTVKYDKAWSFDSSSQEWKWYMKSKGYRRGLWNVNHTMGIWVNVTQDSNLTVAGVVPAQTAIHLIAGWNLVSFPSFNSTYTVADLKVETAATRVEGMEKMPPYPPYRLRVLGDAEVLLMGQGYWVKVEADTDWIVEVS